MILCTTKQISIFKKLLVAIVVLLISIVATSASENDKPWGIDSFSSGKITFNQAQNTTYIHSSGNVAPSFTVQLCKIKDTQVKIGQTGNLLIDLRDWKPAKYRESKVIRFQFIKADDIKKLAGKKIKIKLTISSDREAAGKLFGEGRTKEKHYYFANDINIGMEKSFLTVSKLLPEELQALCIRLDLVTPAKYQVFDASISAADDNIKDTETAKIPEGVNLLTNGDAEWGFYNTMWNNPIVRKIGGKYTYNGKFLSEQTTFAIDENEKHSGKRSFRCNGQKNALGDLYFAPVPYVVGKKVFLTFYAKAEKPRTQICPVLFLAAGIAYGYSSPIILDTNWKKYKFSVIWGEDKGEGLRKVGDVINGYGCQYVEVMPRFSANGTAWIDDVTYSIGQPAPEKTPLRRLNITGKLDHSDGLYKSGDTVKTDIVLENVSKKKEKYSITAEFTDFKGTGTGVKKLTSLDLVPGEKKNYSFSIVPEKYGSFTLSVKAICQSSGKVYVYNLIGGVVPAAKKNIKRCAVDIPAGFNIAFSIPYLKNFGIGAVRLWSAYREWGEYIGLNDVPLLHNAGMWVLLNVSPPDRYGRVPKDMSAVKTRWKKEFAPTADDVNCFEILNEPNIWRNRAKPNPAYEDMSSKAYVRYLDAAVEVFKKLNPKALIAGPATCHTDVSFTSGVLAAGGGKYLDAITEHPYRNKPELPDYDADLRALRKVAENRPIFATENGSRFPAIARDNILCPKYLERLAEAIRMPLIAYGCGNDIYTTFSWAVDPVGMSWQVFMGGSPDGGGMPRPAPVLYAIRAMADIIGKAPSLGRIKLGNNYRSYMFDQGNNRVVAIWKFDGQEAIINLSGTPGKTKLMDMMGNTIELSKAPLNQFPVYLVSNANAGEIRKYFSGLNFKSSGKPIVASLHVRGENKVSVKVINMRNQAVKALVSMGEEHKSINLKAEENVFVNFNVKRPISTLPQMFTAKVSIGKDQESLSVKRELRAMFAPFVGNDLNIDGDLSDWPKTMPMELGYKNSVRYMEWNENEKNVKADVRTAWNNNHLYIAVTVYKRGLYPTNRQTTWEGDGLQIAFDPTCNARKGGGYNDDDFEYGVALQSGNAKVYRYHASSASYDSLPKTIGKLDGSEVKTAIKVYPDHQVYEMAFSRRAVSPFRLQAGNVMNWDMIVNMSNGKKRIGYLEITPGIGSGKDPYMFMPLLLKK